jgi:hypothetical protein
MLGGFACGSSSSAAHDGSGRRTDCGTQRPGNSRARDTTGNGTDARTHRHACDIFTHIARTIGVVLSFIIVENFDDFGRVGYVMDRNEDFAILNSLVVKEGLRFGESTSHQRIAISFRRLVLGQLDDDLDVAIGHAAFAERLNGLVRVILIGKRSRDDLTLIGIFINGSWHGVTPFVVLFLN